MSMNKALLKKKKNISGMALGKYRKIFLTRMLVEANCS